MFLLIAYLQAPGLISLLNLVSFVFLLNLSCLVLLCFVYTTSSESNFSFHILIYTHFLLYGQIVDWKLIHHYVLFKKTLRCKCPIHILFHLNPIYFQRTKTSLFDCKILPFTLESRLICSGPVSSKTTFHNFLRHPTVGSTVLPILRQQRQRCLSPLQLQWIFFFFFLSV